MKQTGRGRRIAFAALCAACIVVVIGYALLSRRARASRTVAPFANQTAWPASVSAPPGLDPPKPAGSGEHSRAPLDAGAAPPPSPRKSTLFFRANLQGDNYGKLAVASTDAPNARRFSAGLECDRVHFAAGRGLCLASDLGVFTSYYAIEFDERLRAGWKIKLDGAPSRARISPSGRLAALTVFLSGHSYTSTNFSTRTLILDAVTGKVLADLEQFAVTRSGLEFKSKDFNFWGVTFSRNEDRIFATLWSAGKTFLVECSLANRTAKVIHENVECPSLSPDNTRIAFKKRTNGKPVGWRIHVLDLKIMEEIALAETRNVDDQVEWLDDSTLLYALSQSATGESASVVSTN